ncbi:phosphodiester glycosidase family protein [Hoyosella sp. YIM 151337]|uniref:phosphodiester glycosidase family protein n=1 Tax=Hoyosella sp. YIM 151337 TaxID=2992742 RepID=UPI002235FB11|nr:phosphodiester glycosidase family protein [Hoyosella sp. YIM 151337]MCW4353957.1 phosphodiester glycosidase family protein [Hoyosella sp. YIM 151337]
MRIRFRRFLVCLAVASCAAMSPALGLAAPPDARALFAEALDAAGGHVVAYQAGTDYPAPMQSVSLEWYSTQRDVRIVVIPNASQSITGRLLLDAHGGAARCADNPNARTADGTPQQSALFSAREAWEALERPAILINTNFFDVRPQLGGYGWRDTNCSTPFGVYYDNYGDPGRERLSEGVRSDGTGRFYQGPMGLTGELENGWGRLATFIISGDGTGESTIDMLVAPRPFENPAAEQRLDELEEQGRAFVAFAGLSLLHPSGDVDIPDDARTGRSAIGYSPKYDRLYLVQAGSNMDAESGLTQAELGDLFRGLGATMAVQLDSGGSSALVVHRGSGVHWAGQGVADGVAPAGACPELAEAVCSPGISPDGESRSVPAWLGIGSPVFTPDPEGVPEAVPDNLPGEPTSGAAADDAENGAAENPAGDLTIDANHTILSDVSVDDAH